MVDAAGDAGFDFKDGTNYGVLVFNNKKMVDLKWTDWCTAVVVASNGFLSGGQDLINLAIGRNDVPVHYLPGRFNVQLAFPKTKNAWVAGPFCAYGQTVPLAAATGDPTVVSFAHFIWLPKPWSLGIDDAIKGVKDAIDGGYRTGHSFITFATPYWVNKWRDFAKTTKLFQHHQLPRVPEFGAVNLVWADECIDAAHPDKVPLACGVPRSAKDEPWPRGYSSNITYHNALKAPGNYPSTYPKNFLQH